MNTLPWQVQDQPTADDLSFLNQKINNFTPIINQLIFPSSGTGSPFWAISGSNIYNTNSGSVGVNTANPAANVSLTVDQPLGGQVAQFASSAGGNPYITTLGGTSQSYFGNNRNSNGFVGTISNSSFTIKTNTFDRMYFGSGIDYNLGNLEYGSTSGLLSLSTNVAAGGIPSTTILTPISLLSGASGAAAINFYDTTRNGGTPTLFSTLSMGHTPGPGGTDGNVSIDQINSSPTPGGTRWVTHYNAVGGCAPPGQPCGEITFTYPGGNLNLGAYNYIPPGDITSFLTHAVFLHTETQVSSNVAFGFGAAYNPVPGNELSIHLIPPNVPGFGNEINGYHVFGLVNAIIRFDKPWVTGRSTETWVGTGSGTTQLSNSDLILNAAVSSFTFTIGGSTQMVVSASGVGIGGTVTPAATLDIKTGADSHILLGQWGNVNTYNILSLNGLTGSGNQIAGLLGGATADNNIFLISPSSITFTSGLNTIGRFYPNGNLGVGNVSTPAFKLDTGSYEQKTNACAGVTTCTATCTAGKQVMSGGCSGVTTTFSDSYPSSTSAWTCTITLGNVTAYAICMNID